MKAIVYIPGFGRTTYEVESLDAERRLLEARYPQHQGHITVRPAEPRQYSDTERAAMEEE